MYVDAVLSGVQQRNLEAAWGYLVLDRVGLIIGIFGQRARTREAKVQVNLEVPTPGLSLHTLPLSQLTFCLISN